MIRTFRSFAFADFGQVQAPNPQLTEHLPKNYAYNTHANAFIQSVEMSIVLMRGAWVGDLVVKRIESSSIEARTSSDGNELNCFSRIRLSALGGAAPIFARIAIAETSAPTEAPKSINLFGN